MKSSQRIAVNTLATYARSVFALVLGLFTSRWLLQALGPVDYGLMAVVGGLIVFIGFLNSVTRNSCSRFFALSIGKDDEDETNRWFNTALSIHIIISAILILIGWPIGEWLIVNFLNIPPDRLDTARWVFRFSLIVTYLGMSTTPYLAMFTAKQHISEMAAWGMASSIKNVFIVYFLTIYQGNRWFLYAAINMTIAFPFLLGQVLRARYLFKECRIRLDRWYEWKRIRQVFSFSGWQLFGSFGHLVKGNGIAILLNRYFNPDLFPHVNASFSIGHAVSGHTKKLSSAMLGAFSPEITATEGRGNRQRMLHQANQACKFGAFLVALFAVPVMIELENLLVLWLQNPPELAATFCRLILIMTLIDICTQGYTIGIFAFGRIALYQMIMGTLLILTLPLAWIFLFMGYSAVSVGWAMVFTISLLSIGRVLWAKYLIGVSPRRWLFDVFFPVSIVIVGASLSGYFLIQGWILLGYSTGFLRIFATSAATFIASLILGWLVVFDASERQTGLQYMQRLYLLITQKKLNTST